MLPTYPESRRRAFARNLLRNGLGLTRGENLLVETWSATLPWAISLTAEARTIGARPLLSVKDEPTYWRSVAEGATSQIGRVGDHEWAALRASDVYVYLYGPLDTVREESLPQAAVRRAESNNHELMRVLQKHGVRTARWDLGRTSELWAKRYGVGLHTWREELISASLIDPQAMRRAGRPIGQKLEAGHTATITHPNGTSLALRLARRRAKLDDGVIDADDLRSGNVIMVVPSGVASVTPAETYAEGSFVSNATGVLYARNRETPLSPGRWVFEDGGLVGYDRARAGKELGLALSELDNPRVPPGQLSVGLNPRISRIPLLFDQERGAITFEIGRNAPMGGRSRTPRLMAYLPLRGGSLEVDGEPLVRRGELVAG